MLKNILTFILSCTLLLAYGQNRHWQNAVDYRMEIDMDVDQNKYDGKQWIQYTNNSPDALDVVFYHLYFNAFQPGSMMDTRSRTISDPDQRVGDRISKLSPAEIGLYQVNKVTLNGEKQEFTISHTTLKVHLSQPIAPGETVELYMDFAAQVPVQIRRSGRDNEEGIRYSMSQWYPKLAEYDEMGWHADPYVGREFHGVWGDFDVKIMIDPSYVVAATGYLQNPEDIGYGYTDEEIKRNKGKITYHFSVDDVHDFTWAADPDYRHDSYTTADGLTLRSFYQEGEQTKNWDSLLYIMEEAFRYASEHFGQYPYKEYNFVQGGDGGMEYPLLTLITGHRPLSSLVGVSVHEMMHSWYQGVLGTNEALYPWMAGSYTHLRAHETKVNLV